MKLSNHRWEALSQSGKEYYVVDTEYKGEKLVLSKDKDVLGTSHIPEILSRIATSVLMSAQGSYISVVDMGDNYIVLSTMWYDSYNECYQSYRNIYAVDSNLNVFSTTLV